MFVFPDSSDDLRDHGNRGKSIKYVVGPVLGQSVHVLRIITNNTNNNLAVRVVF